MHWTDMSSIEALTHRSNHDSEIVDRTKLSFNSSKYVLDLQTTTIRTPLQFQTAQRPFEVIPDTRPQPHTTLLHSDDEI
jgi:hypothetical protein